MKNANGATIALFLEELLNTCNSAPELRSKRDFGASAAIIIETGVAGVALGRYGFYRTISLTEEQSHIKDKIRDIKNVMAHKDFHLNKLKKEMEILMLNIAKSNDITKEDTMNFSLTITNFIGEMYYEKFMLEHTHQLWKIKKMDESFFKFFKIKQPLNVSAKSYTFHSCKMNDDKSELELKYSIPTVQANMHLIKADPFTLYTRENNAWCQYTNAGTKQAIISTKVDCVQAIRDADLNQDTLFIPPHH